MTTVGRGDIVRAATATLAALALVTAPALAADWAMWRYDAGRTAASPEELPAQLHLRWVRQLPEPQAAWPWNQYKLLFDESYEPVAAGDTLFVPSMVRDRVTAYEGATGKEKWRFYAEGPVRFAPAVANGKVYLVSDDGCLYCLNAGDGSLRFRFRAAPTARKVLGNERMISTWPARGGPVLLDGTVYFAAGIWPFMGTLIYGLDAETGKAVWENSGSGAMYLLQPHESPAFAGVAPQGCLAALGDALLVPGGRSVPAAYDRATGQFRYYRGNTKEGGYEVCARGEWFANGGAIYRAADGVLLASCSATVLDDSTMYGLTRDGLVVAQALRKPDEKVVTKKNNRGQEYQVTEYTFPELWRANVGLSLTRIYLKAGSRLYAGGKDGLVAAVGVPATGGQAKVPWQTRIEGEPWSMIAADGRLFVVTRTGRLYCFGGEQTAAPPVLTEPNAAAAASDDWTAGAASILKATGVTEGYALVLGTGTGRLAEELAHQSRLHVVGLEPDAERADALRRRLDAAGLYGSRVAILTADLASAELPPYFASLIVSEESPGADLGRLFACLRPYGGVACLSGEAARGLGLASSEDVSRLAKAEVRQAGEWTLLLRQGALPGAGTWTHQYGDIGNSVNSTDALVKAPLGLLWFGGPPNLEVLPRHGHGPSPQVIGGRLFIEGIGVLSARDVYTGRVLWSRKFEDLDTFGAYYNETYNPDPYDRSYNQVHITGANELGSNFVAAEDRVYLIAGPKCHVLDPATGATLTDFVLNVEGEQATPNWGYIGVYGELLIATAMPMAITDEGITSNARFAAGSQYLLVIDRHSGQTRWTRKAAYQFRHNTIVAGSGKVFCIDGMSKAKLDLLHRRGIEPAEKPKLMALDVQTGKVVWSTEKSVFGTWLGYSAEHDVLLQGGSKSGDRPTDEAAAGMVAYRGADGTVLWQTNEAYLGPPILHHGQIITQVSYGTQKATPAKAYDLLSGKELTRTHRLTGETIPWTWLRFYGCNTAVASENLLTFRSAAASFVDLAAGQGTASIGGFKSGCTSNLIVADGVLNAPDYTRTCTCSYQNQSSLALVPDPSADLWCFDSYPAPAQPTPVRRVGLNLGAPGNRVAPDGTLFLEVPSVGGPSPDIPVRLSMAQPRWFRRHSAFFAGEANWVGASGLEGAGTITIRAFLQPGVSTDGTVAAFDRNAFTTSLGATVEPQGAFDQPQEYTVRLYFAEPDDRQAGERVFSVALQGRQAIEDLDIVEAAGGPRQVVVREFAGVRVKDDLTISLTSTPGSKLPPLLCGLELLAASN